MFEGVFTAIVTPFTEDGLVDWEALRNLIEFQIENKVTGIVPVGTTGESPTLSHDEHEQLVRLVVKWINGRCKVIAGTGSNSTAEAVAFSREAEFAGADGCLVVSPYYNKPTQEGLYRHFKTVADSVKIPVIVYNIKGRTGVNIETSTLMRLAKDCKNITTVKEASGDISQIKEVLSQRPAGFSVLSGDDGMTLDVIKNGGNGVISVASNLFPSQMSEMVTAALKGDFHRAETIHNELNEFFVMESIETNPIPLKAAMAMKGLCKEVYRLPMCEMMPENREKLQQLLKKMQII